MTREKPRRLLTVGHSYIIGTSRRLPTEIQAASNGRWEVTVAAPTYFEGNPKYGQLRPESLLVGGDEQVEVVGVPMARTTQIHVTSYSPRLRHLMQRGFDLIHCWQEPYIFCGGQLAWWTPRNTALTFLTFQNIQKRYPPPFSWIERYTVSRADGWIAGGESVEKALADRPVYRRRPHRVIGLGVDVERFSPNPIARAAVLQTLGWPTEGPVTIGYLGRLTNAKGLPLLMRCLDRLSVPWRALFVGSGNLAADVAVWGARHGSRVRHVSNVAHEDVAAYINAFDILCAPSQTTPTWREQFGRMLIEAFACGVPVIASDSGEIPSVVGDAGRIVGEKDTDGWVIALEELVTQEGLRRELSSRGLTRVRERYTWSSIGSQYVDFFDSILEGASE